jgi:hypothetical protein
LLKAKHGLLVDLEHRLIRLLEGLRL